MPCPTKTVKAWQGPKTARHDIGLKLGYQRENIFLAFEYLLALSASFNVSKTFPTNFHMNVTTQNECIHKVQILGEGYKKFKKYPISF